VSREYGPVAWGVRIGRVAALILIVASVWASGMAVAHDLITAEAAERYLAQASDLQHTIGSKSPSVERAQAQVALGAMLDEIRDLLNRDIAEHGRVQGLPSAYLVAELTARGTPLATAPDGAYFVANIAHYREALRLAPNGPSAAEAELRLLKGYFYDSFTDDPLQPRAQTWAQLSAQIDIGQRCLQRELPPEQREEAEFIVAVHYLQAARGAPDSATRVRYAKRAREALSAFEARYPESLRVAASAVLREQIPK